MDQSVAFAKFDVRRDGSPQRVPVSEPVELVGIALACADLAPSDAWRLQGQTLQFVGGACIRAEEGALFR